MRTSHKSSKPLNPTRTSPSPASEPKPASHTGPTGPTLRANPCSEVTDPICRLPLPTLVYRPEASDLGDPMRIWVRPDPNLAGNQCSPQTWSIVIKPTAPVTSKKCGGQTRIFQGPAVAPGTPQESWRSTANRVPLPFLTADGFQGHGALNRKENSFPDYRQRTRAVRQKCPPLPANPHGRQADTFCPGTGYGIITVFPFATNPLRQLLSLRRYL